MYQLVHANRAVTNSYPRTQNEVRENEKPELKMKRMHRIETLTLDIIT
jgi:hypothetical protein